jgi:hypothetical protein
MKKKIVKKMILVIKMEILNRNLKRDQRKARNLPLILKKIIKENLQIIKILLLLKIRKIR